MVNEVEKTAINEVLRTVTLINKKIEVAIVIKYCIKVEASLTPQKIAEILFNFKFLAE